MTVKIKAVQKANPLNRTIKKYYPVVHTTEITGLDEIADEISDSTTMTRTDVAAALEAFSSILIKEIKKGHICKLGNLGTFYVKLHGIGTETEEEVGFNSVAKAKVGFRPGKRLLDAIQTLDYEKVTIEKAAA